MMLNDAKAFLQCRGVEVHENRLACNSPYIHAVKGEQDIHLDGYFEREDLEAILAWWEK